MAKKRGKKPVTASGTGKANTSNVCLSCGEVILPGMVRVVEAGGMRHVPGALVCRRGGPLDGRASGLL